MVEKPGFAGGLTSTRDGVVYLFTLDTSTLYSLNTSDVRGAKIISTDLFISNISD